MSIEKIVILIGFVFLSLWFIYLEIKRPLGARLPWRIIATILAMASIYFILQPLMISSKVSRDASAQVLITDGYSPDSLNAQENLITFDGAIASQYPKIKYYSSVAAYKIYEPSPSSIKIYGNGLSGDELTQLLPANLDFKPAIPTGLVKAGWTKLVSDHFILQGLYRNDSPEKMVIKLFSFNTLLDSVVVNDKTDSAFVLTANPQLSGLSLFRIAGLQNGDTIFNYPVPFQAISPVKPRILLRSSSPDFEFKYLRNWLFDNGYSVSTYAPVSRGRSVAVFNNSEKTGLSALTANILANTDLLIVDEKSLSDYANVITNSVGRGMGLLVTTATPINRTIAAATLRSVPVAGDNFRISLGGNTSLLNPLMVDEPKVMATNNNRQALAKLGNNPLVQQHIYGLGKVSVSTVLQTYQWLLQGNNEDYARYWSHLINKSARQTAPALNYQINTTFPLPGEKITFEIASPNPDSILINKMQLPLEEDLLQPGLWKTFYWPTAAGWQELSGGSTLKSSFYVYDAADWMDARARERIDLNQRIMYKEKKTAGKSELKNLRQQAPVPELIWFLLFLVNAGFLWAERKKS